MKSGEDSLISIAELLRERRLKYTDTIIIGDNSSGKSLLLKILIESLGKTDSVYFIDAVNRGFDVRMVIEESKKPEYKQTVVSTRIQKEFFNLKDSFNCYGTMTERIEEIYFPYEVQLQELFEQLTGDRFQVVPGESLGEVIFGASKGHLSSGYQAIVRLILELLFYQEQCLDKKGIDSALVIIDELDEFLSPGYAYAIFSFLKEKFPKMNFAITTHSSDLVAGAKNANLIILDMVGYEVLDSNDYQSNSEVQLIFERVFGQQLQQASEIEDTLRRLLNNKINKVWTEREQLQLERIQKGHLTASQQLIYKQITEW